MPHTGRQINIKACILTDGGYYGKGHTNVSMYVTQNVSLLAQAIRVGYEAVNPGKEPMFRVLKKVYYPRGDRFLSDTETIASEGLRDGDLVILTNTEDKFVLDTVAKIKSGMSIHKSKKEKKWVRVIRGLVRGIPWVGEALDALLEKD